jgi:hypothetical protein
MLEIFDPRRLAPPRRDERVRAANERVIMRYVYRGRIG